MSELDKAIVAKAFQVNSNTNIDYIILVANDVYDIGINNLDIRFVI